MSITFRMSQSCTNSNWYIQIKLPQMNKREERATRKGETKASVEEAQQPRAAAKLLGTANALLCDLKLNDYVGMTDNS